MRIKLNRGPMAGKIMDYYDDYATLVRVRMPEQASLRPFFDPDIRHEVPLIKEGTYARSNVKLKDGTVVFEWMGWIE